MCSLIWEKSKEKEDNPDTKIFRYMTIWKALEENVGVYSLLRHCPCLETNMIKEITENFKKQYLNHSIHTIA